MTRRTNRPRDLRIVTGEDVPDMGEAELMEAARLAFNPDGMITVSLPSGGWATVSPDCPPETLAALDRVIAAAAKQFGGAADV